MDIHTNNDDNTDGTNDDTTDTETNGSTDTDTDTNEAETTTEDLDAQAEHQAEGEQMLRPSTRIRKKPNWFRCRLQTGYGQTRLACALFFSE